MSLLEQASGDTHEPPVLEVVPSAEKGDPRLAVAEVGYDYDTVVEALKVDSLMTAARFHRDEAQRTGMPDFQAELHQKQFDSHVGSLAMYGIGAEDIPEASLKYAGPVEVDLRPPAVVPAVAA